MLRLLKIILFVLVAVTVLKLNTQIPDHMRFDSVIVDTFVPAVEDCLQEWLPILLKRTEKFTISQ